MDHEAARIAVPDLIDIRQAGPGDLPAIQEFLRRAYGELAPYKGEQRWRWQFADNPYVLSENGLSPVWLAMNGDDVVGQIAVQAGLFKIGDQVRPGGWIVDVMILPQFRGRQLGHRLYDAVSRRVPMLLMLTMAPATRKMAARGGAVTLNHAGQYSRWIHFHANDVRRYVCSRAAERPGLLSTAHWLCTVFQMHRLIAGAANLYLARREAPASVHPPGFAIREIQRFGADTDQFWNRISAGFHALQVRDSLYLNWRFRECPGLHYRCFTATSGQEIVGHSVLRQAEAVEKRQGIIAEILVAPGDMTTFRALVAHAIAFFGRDVASVECVTSLPDAASLLRGLGFMRTRHTAATCSTDDPVAAARLANAGCQSRSDARWLFTKGDHDWDQIHLG